MVDDLHRADMLHIDWAPYWLVGTDSGESWSTLPPYSRVSVGSWALTGAATIESVGRAVALTATLEITRGGGIPLRLYTSCGEGLA